MLEKKLTLSIFITLFLVSIGVAQAAKPEEKLAGKAEHKESFWDRWLPRSEQLEAKREKATNSDKSDRYQKEKRTEQKKKSEHYFSKSERSNIEDYYRRDRDRDRDRDEDDDKKDKKNKKNKGKSMPYGLQKKLERGGQLPPGWQTKVARGEVLGDDILRHSERIPQELAIQLPELRDGEAVRRVGDKVVRVLEGNGTVIDVIDLADVLLR